MVKTITRVGNSHGVIFDSALLELAHLKPGDELNVEVHDGGTITLTPVRKQPSRAAVSEEVKRIIRDYSETLKKLS